MARSPIVIPSTELDAHLHGTAAELIKNRHSTWQQQELSPSDSSPPVANSGNHGDDLMTPPDELLALTLQEAERASENKDAEGTVRLWVKAAALSRIVHGDGHWQLAKCHILLAKAYLELQDLKEQALTHALKACDILLSSGDHVTSHDPSHEAIYSLARAQCLVGRVLTSEGKLSEAERSLVKAQQTAERCRRQEGSSVGVQLDLEITMATGRLYTKQDKYELAQCNLRKAVDLSKAAYGARNSGLVPLLRELAQAVQCSGDTTKALEVLRVAQEIAEESHGRDSEAVGGVLLHLARAHMVQSQENKDGSGGPVEELLQRAYAIYCSRRGVHHRETILCHEELCRLLISEPSSMERVVPILKDVISAKKVAYDSCSPEVADSYKLLGSVYLKQGKVEQARKWLGKPCSSNETLKNEISLVPRPKAREAYSSSLGARHKETMAIVRSLEIICGSLSTATPSTGESRNRPRFQTVV